MQQLREGVGTTMTTEGNISRLELIAFAAEKMDEVLAESARIDEAMTGERTLDQLENLYAQSRENAGKQRVLREILERFNANTVVPDQRKGRIVAMGGSSVDPFAEDNMSIPMPSKPGRGGNIYAKEGEAGY